MRDSPSWEVTHTRACRTFQEALEESRRTAAAEEAKRGVAADPDTRPLDQSSSSTDPEPQRPKTTTMVDTENSADQMDEDNLQRAPATCHPLEPDADENVSKKAQVARNALHIRGDDEVKFDVNEEFARISRVP